MWQWRRGAGGRVRGIQHATVLALLLTALACTLIPAGAHARGRSFWGVVDGPTAQTNRDLRLMRRGGVGTDRFVLWHSVVQQSGWSSYDRFIGKLARKRIRALPDLFTGGGYSPPISGNARQSWVQFAHNAAARYGPGGSFWHAHPRLPKRPVRAWQVGNEPSLPKYWPTKSPVRDYATFLKITHDAIRGVNSHATIVLAGLPGVVVDRPYRGWKFLNKLYRVGGVKGDFNVAAFHPYAHHLRDLAPQMRKFRHVMRRHGDKHTPVWITEFGYGSGRRDGRLNFGKKGQARMLRKTFRAFAHKRRRWNVRGVVWYQWRDPAQQNPDCSFCSTSGLLHSNLRPKPAYRAFKHIAR
jgi:polysaccharide biosynthesis protein PslG